MTDRQIISKWTKGKIAELRMAGLTKEDIVTMIEIDLWKYVSGVD